MTSEERKPLQRIILDASRSARRDSIVRRRSKNLSQVHATWTTESKIGDDVGTAISIVFTTLGCSYARGDAGGCTMCSYLLDGTEQHPTDEQLQHQFQSVIEKHSNLTGSLSVKLYTSGSFLDEGEVSRKARFTIIDMIAQDDRITEVVIESRPEYVTDDAMSELRKALSSQRIEIGIGLESSSDIVRGICINKGFTLDEFKHAIQIAAKYDIGVRAYVLLKPPFLTERGAYRDTLSTIQECGNLGVTTVSLNPVNVQRNTLVETLWEKGEYRPAWLWTLVDVLQKGRSVLKEGINLVCDPVAAGKSRGVHNCGKCDKKIVKRISTFSLTQDISTLDGLECDCRTQWSHTLEHEDTSLLVHSNRRLR
ncbi:MAG: archaeosine biosynthesis radical SAM protein RaSEA [Candidatus Thorarchaeota archaeon]|jgi:radical SAM enzyme (TIGR01210 family)